MDIINPNLTRMPLVSIIGFPALLTRNRVCKQTVHMNLYTYELQGEDPMIVSRQAQDNFYATVITPAPLLMDGVSQLMLSPGDIVEDPESRCYTPAELERWYFER